MSAPDLHSSARRFLRWSGPSAMSMLRAHPEVIPAAIEVEESKKRPRRGLLRKLRALQQTISAAGHSAAAPGVGEAAPANAHTSTGAANTPPYEQI